MYFTQTTVTLAVLAIAKLAVATPPACLLAAVNTQPDVGDVQAICGGSNATSVQNTIGKICNDEVNAALSAFASSCQAKGYTVPSPTVSPTTSQASFSAQATGSSGTGTSSGATPTKSSAAGHINLPFGAAAVGAIVVGLAL